MSKVLSAAQRIVEAEDACKALPPAQCDADAYGQSAYFSRLAQVTYDDGPTVARALLALMGE